MHAMRASLYYNNNNDDVDGRSIASPPPLPSTGATQRSNKRTNVGRSGASLSAPLRHRRPAGSKATCALLVCACDLIVRLARSLAGSCARRLGDGDGAAAAAAALRVCERCGRVPAVGGRLRRRRSPQATPPPASGPRLSQGKPPLNSDMGCCGVWLSEQYSLRAAQIAMRRICRMDRRPFGRATPPCSSAQKIACRTAPQAAEVAGECGEAALVLRRRSRRCDNAALNAVPHCRTQRALLFRLFFFAQKKTRAHFVLFYQFTTTNSK